MYAAALDVAVALLIVAAVAPPIVAAVALLGCSISKRWIAANILKFEWNAAPKRDV